jgi:hypothetical protein
METKQEINPEMQAGIELESETRVKWYRPDTNKKKYFRSDSENKNRALKETICTGRDKAVHINERRETVVGLWDRRITL